VTGGQLLVSGEDESAGALGEGEQEQESVPRYRDTGDADGASETVSPATPADGE
jgi:hypothetical protein